MEIPLAGDNLGDFYEQHNKAKGSLWSTEHGLGILGYTWITEWKEEDLTYVWDATRTRRSIIHLHWKVIGVQR